MCVWGGYINGMEYPAKGTILAPWERWNALRGVVEGTRLVKGGTGSAAVVVILGGGVCSAVTGVSIPERSLREGVVWRFLNMTSRRGEVHVHVLGVIFGRAVNALLRTTPTTSAAWGTRLRSIAGGWGKGPGVYGCGGLAPMTSKRITSIGQSGQRYGLAALASLAHRRICR